MKEGKPMRRVRYLFPLVLLLALVVSPVLAPAQAQSKTLVWDQYDVFINVLPNGDLRVTERQTIAFTSGTFSFGFAVIPLDRTNGIYDVAINEPSGPVYQEVNYGTDPYTFYTNQSGNEIEIRWLFPPVANETRTYDLSYTVKGAVRIYDSGDKLQWMAIDNERDFPIRNASVQVSLPDGAQFLDIDSAGVAAEWQQSEDRRTVSYVATESMSPTETFEIGVEFTHGVIPAGPPSWQTAYDQETYYDLNVRPLLTLGVGVVAALIGLGGPLLVYLLWYSRGRDPKVGPVPEYIEQPPDDLPPGLLGSLIDEQADMQDIVASIVDLARRGFLKIEEKEEKGFFGIASKEFVFRKADGADESELRPYERRLMKGIFPGNRKVRELTDMRNKFYTKLPKIQEDLYKELVTEGLFKSRPDKTRSRWAGLGIFGLVIAFILGIALSALAQYAVTFPCLAVGFGLGGVALMIMGRHMPAKSVKGAEAAAKWMAFRNYLTSIEKMTDLEKAGSLFEGYLPYAIAFGMNQSFVSKFARLADTPAPGWYVPYPRSYGRVSGGSGRGLAKEMPAGTSAPGGLQEMSDSMAGGLQSMSDGLTSMLNSTGRILRSAPSSSGTSGGGGGGFSGGGFSVGGGGGGGGRGFG
jgi:uncharacterized membrane protein